MEKIIYNIRSVNYPLTAVHVNIRYIIPVKSKLEGKKYVAAISCMYMSDFQKLQLFIGINLSIPPFHGRICPTISTIQSFLYLQLCAKG